MTSNPTLKGHSVVPCSNSWFIKFFYHFSRFLDTYTPIYTPLEVYMCIHTFTNNHREVIYKV